MPHSDSLKDTIFNITTRADFEEVAVRVFLRQARDNEIYRSFIKALKINPENVQRVEEIPFLPISFFKSHAVKTGVFQPEITFTSSGTTGQIPSAHHVKNVAVYQESFRKGFAHFYGDVSSVCVLALLPTYLERQGSSLVFMADDFIAQSNHEKSGFYLHNLNELKAVLLQLADENTPTLLLGVSFALLDLADLMPKNFVHENLTIMETGGMKGRRKELIRTELHDQLKAAFGAEQIHSEYGMTELLSQAYAKKDGLFFTPPWMRLLIRDTSDPLTLHHQESTGGVNVIDLANVHSCAFLATEDLGRKHKNGAVEILGRFDTAEIRGCNLMIE